MSKFIKLNIVKDVAFSKKDLILETIINIDNIVEINEVDLTITLSSIRECRDGSTSIVYSITAESMNQLLSTIDCSNLYQ